jgi:hypothetical protein
LRDALGDTTQHPIGHEKKTIHGDLKLWHERRCVDRPYLRLTDADQCLFVTKIHFDIPTPHERLQELFYVEIRIGADQIRWFAIEQMRTFSGSVRQRAYDYQSHGHCATGGTPPHRARSL